ncbi:alpha/beta hydrolase [Microbulbifer sp. TRSA001]|uniref:alpha/beta hydrolase n=1 Tax=unclassified Microbulbifer TaxID=2619833 RepID=UPI0024AD3EBF|nr:alpha/beta hydrolase [Microbulbifer sp. VAAF005]WHI46051.1 alpha/beta hydrolase [Microbulbifer sp. VAAF005]
MSEFWNCFTREKTDEQYNPVLWTHRLPTDLLLPSHAEFTGSRSLTYRKAIKDGLQTVSFGKGDYSGSMDVFRPDKVPENAPVVIYIHGGWWQWFSKEQFSFLAKPFNKEGFAVYMPGYRMATDWKNDTPMESIVAQMQWAVASVLKEAEEKGSPSVYLVGHSVGGQLVALLHQTDWSQFGVPVTAQRKFKGAFSLAGIFDVRPLVNSFFNDLIKMSMESAEKVSPQMLVSGIDTTRCPLHLIVPEFDTLEFFRQTKEYQEKMLEMDNPCYFKLANNRDHLDLIEKLVDDQDEVLAYMLENMKA